MRELPWKKNHFPEFLFASKTLILFHYQFPVDKLITGLKFNHTLANATLLGKLMSHKIKRAYQNESIPELIIPVPLSSQRLRERGFNQSLEIAKVVSKSLHIPISNHTIHRIKNTIPQSDLPQKERLKNMRGAFEIKAPIKQKHIALLDDVTTTGETMREIIKTICSDEKYNHNTKKIDVWCCAQTVHSANKIN